MISFRRRSSGSAALLAALLVACGGKPAEPPPPPPPPIVDLAVTPRSAWDSLQLAIAKVLQSGSAAQARPLRDKLMRFPEEPGKGDPNSGHDALPGPSRAVRLYLLGELAEVMKDVRGLQAATDSLLGPPLVGSALPRKPMLYAMGLQAIAYLRMGDTAEALARLDSVIAAIPAERYPMLWVGGTIERPQRIALLRTWGKTARADSLAGTVTSYSADRLIKP